jgi:hypothetical protein
VNPHKFSFLRSSVGASSLLLGVFLAACSSSSSNGPPPATSGVLQIASLVPAGGPKVTPVNGVCVELGDDPGGTVAVVLATDSSGQLLPRRVSTAPAWTLMPPHACDGTPYCGYVQLTVVSCDPASQGAGCVPSREKTFAVPSSTISVAMRALEVPVGPHVFRVELRNSDGAIEKDPSGQPFEDAVTVDVERHCGAPIPDAGTDAGTKDAAVSDAAADAAVDAMETGPNDAAVRDASRPDGAVDSGSHIDASSVDARVTD